MTAAALVLHLQSRGVELVPDGESLLYRPVDRITPDELARLRALKLEVMAVLSRRPTYYASPWPDAITGLGDRTVGPFDPCAECERWSWVRYGLLVLCIACARRRELEPKEPA